MQDRIEKTIDLNAPVARVWRALTDPREFGAWFQVRVDDSFVVGKTSSGITTCPGYEGMKWAVDVKAVEPERRFAFTWCPYEHDDSRDHATAPRTLVEFRLEPTEKGTRLILSESGFSELPDDPERAKALRANAQGWDWQANNLAAYVST